MDFPYITAMAGGAIIILQMLLNFHIIMGRYKYKTNIGDGGNDQLLLRIRAHGNLSENGALYLVALGLLELSGASKIVTGVFALWFVLARLAHAFGLNRTSDVDLFRFFGAASTILLGIALGAYLVFTGFERFSL